MYEELLNPEEIQEENIYPKIHVGKANCIGTVQLNELLHDIEKIESRHQKNILVKVANGQWEYEHKVPYKLI